MFRADSDGNMQEQKCDEEAAEREGGCLSRLTYILPGQACTQADTGLSQYVAHENAAVCHGNNGFPIRPQIPRPARLLTGQRPRESPVAVLEHLSTEVQTETVLQA